MSKNNHALHNVLGGYCWTCKTKTDVDIPGWPKKSHSDIVSYADPWTKSEITGFGYCTAITWANGDINSQKDQRPCAVCNKHCSKPVERRFITHRDGYKEVSIRQRDF